MEAQLMEMIVTVVDSGSTDLVVAAAKEAGAHGGTVIKAREVDSEEQKKIFGMLVQPEREIVLMLVRAEQKKEIHKAICAAVLEKTGETRKDCIRDAFLAVQSYAPTMLEAATLSEAVVAAMINAVQLPSVAAVKLNGNYNFTDTATKQYRYQAVFDVTHYEQKG